MSRGEAYLSVMRRWPAYTLDAVADLTPEAIQVLLDGLADENGRVTFSTQAEYLEWARTR